MRSYLAKDPRFPNFLQFGDLHGSFNSSWGIVPHTCFVGPYWAHFVIVDSSSGHLHGSEGVPLFGKNPAFALLACCSPLPFRGLGKPVDLLDFILVYSPFLEWA